MNLRSVNQAVSAGAGMGPETDMRCLHHIAPLGAQVWARKLKEEVAHIDVRRFLLSMHRHMHSQGIAAYLESFLSHLQQLHHSTTSRARPLLHSQPAMSSCLTTVGMQLLRSATHRSKQQAGNSACCRGTMWSLQYLINNAGVAKWADLGSLTEEDMLQLFRTNTLGPLMITQQILREGLLKKGSVVANMTSKV